MMPHFEENKDRHSDLNAQRGFSKKKKALCILLVEFNLRVAYSRMKKYFTFKPSLSSLFPPDPKGCFYSIYS
jgi:hypothetical protein